MCEDSPKCLGAVSALVFTGHLTIGKLCTISVPQFSHLPNDKKNILFTEL